MKTLFMLSLLFTSTLAFAQSKNDQLFQAVIHRDSTKVEELLNNGADANYKRKFGDFDMGMLILSATNQDFKIVKLLVEHKADVNWRDSFQTTALMYAAHSGNLAMAKLLIAHGADPAAKDNQGNSVMSAAKESKNEEVIKLIESLQKN